ncbi:MAG: hypothetical protein M1826_001065 [Phylliscum demangeonii]|nr:MAG: hypothetical protein M1826_001065 [Phylliscum demangeonii]
MKILLAGLVLAPILPSWSLPHPQTQPPHTPLSTGRGFHATKKGVAEAAAAAGVAGLSVYAVTKTNKLQELWNSNKARLEALRLRYGADKFHASVDSLKHARRQREEINAAYSQFLEGPMMTLDDFDAFNEAGTHHRSHAPEEGKRLDQLHDNIPVRQRVGSRMTPWLPPRDLPEECAYSYLSVPITALPRDNFHTVSAWQWYTALEDCARWHGYPEPRAWGIMGSAEVKINRSVTRHTAHAMQEGQGEQVRAAADARKKAEDQGLNFQQHPESHAKKPAPFHVEIPAWATREFRHLGKEAKAAGALRWSSMAEEGKALEMSAIRSGV